MRLGPIHVVKICIGHPLTGRLDSLEERDVEEEVDDADAADHLGVGGAGVEDPAAVVDLQHLSAVRKRSSPAAEPPGLTGGEFI